MKRRFVTLDDVARLDGMDVPALTAPPAGWRETRDALHQLADRVMAPARFARDGKIRLRSLPGGFGTPRVGDEGWQIRVEGTDLVVAVGEDERRRPITSLHDAAAFAGLDPSGLPDDPLAVGADGAAWLGDFYAFVLATLEDLRREAGADEPVLWPEHFDYAIAAGDERTGTQANYGGSPGDAAHAGAYLYVGPFQAQEGELWNATGFAGAELPIDALLRAADQRALALEFFRSRRAALGA